MQQTAHNLGVVLAEDKTEGPATQLTILGIEVDSVAMTLRLPAEKLQRLRTLLAEWQGRKSGLRRELESLVGQLQHACKVVRTGRCFMRRLYDLLANTHHFQKHYRVRLNAECQADVKWWVSFGMHWKRFESPTLDTRVFTAFSCCLRDDKTVFTGKSTYFYRSLFHSC